jgi:hypothetical protein
MQNLEILDSVGGRFLGTGDNKLGYGGAAQYGGALDQEFLL